MHFCSSSTTGCISLWQLDADACTLHLLCTAPLNRRPICLAVADSSVYRKPVPVKPEQCADALANDAVPAAPAARKIISLGRVTIETEGGDDEETNLVSVLQMPMANKAKKPKKRVVEEADEEIENEDDNTTTTPPPSKKANKPKNRTSIVAVEPQPAPKLNGKRKSGSSGFVETPVVDESEVVSKKASKKQKKLNNSATIDPAPTAVNKVEPHNKRRKSSKF